MRLHSNSRSLWGEEGRVEERNIEEKYTICYWRRVRNAEKEQGGHGQQQYPAEGEISD